MAPEFWSCDNHVKYAKNVVEFISKLSAILLQVYVELLGVEEEEKMKTIINLRF